MHTHLYSTCNPALAPSLLSLAGSPRRPTSRFASSHIKRGAPPQSCVLCVPRCTAVRPAAVSLLTAYYQPSCRHHSMCRMHGWPGSAVTPHSVNNRAKQRQAKVGGKPGLRWQLLLLKRPPTAPRPRRPGTTATRAPPPPPPPPPLPLSWPPEPPCTRGGHWRGFRARTAPPPTGSSSSSKPSTPHLAGGRRPQRALRRRRHRRRPQHAQRRIRRVRLAAVCWPAEHCRHQARP